MCTTIKKFELHDFAFKTKHMLSLFLDCLKSYDVLWINKLINGLKFKLCFSILY